MIILVRIAGRRDGQLLAESGDAVERERRHGLPGAEARRHRIVHIETGRDGAIPAGQDQQRSADLLARAERRIQHQARRVAGDQQLPLELALGQARLADQRRHHVEHAALDLTRQRLDIDPLDEAVDDLQFDARLLADLLRQRHHPRQRVAGVHIGLLQFVGELEQLGDADALAGQRGRQFGANGDQLRKLAFDIETGQHKEECLGLLRRRATGRHLGQRYARGRRDRRDHRRRDLAGGGRCRLGKRRQRRAPKRTDRNDKTRPRHP